MIAKSYQTVSNKYPSGIRYKYDCNIWPNCQQRMCVWYEGQIWLQSMTKESAIDTLVFIRTTTGYAQDLKIIHNHLLLGLAGANWNAVCFQSSAWSCKKSLRNKTSVYKKQKKLRKAPFVNNQVKKA